LVTRSLLAEGSGKKIFEDESPDFVIIEFKDHLIDKRSNTKTKIRNKGSINASISVNLFEYLNSYNIRNHYSKKSDDNEITAKKLDMIPLEILIRNYATGKFCKQYGFREGESLVSPVLEFYLKDEKLKKPLISETLIFAKELASKEEVLSITKLACKTNAILKTYFERRNLILIDIQLEFGRNNGQVLLGDEISLETCTIWNAENNQKNKPKINQNMIAIYKTFHERIIGENI
jgi:phosphoribosylaminoimidazole-succinocarboxamide synthase